MIPTVVIQATERLAGLPPAQQAFILQAGCIVIAIAALMVAMKALSRRGR